MPPLPIISGQQAVNAFAKAGWIMRKRGGGSHMIMYKPGVMYTLSIPDHRQLDRGTLSSLIRDSGLTVQQFIILLK